MIVLAADAFVLAVLALTVWLLNGASVPHLPLELLHTLGAELLTALLVIVATEETTRAARAVRRRTTRTNTTTGGNPS